MKDLRSSRRLIQTWHRREKAVIDQVVNRIATLGGDAGRTHSALTDSGVAVEEQLRKAWRPTSAGLAMF